MTRQATLQTERMTLRQLRASDAGMIAHYAGDERVARMTTTLPHPMPHGAAEMFIERSSHRTRTETSWVMDASKIDGPEVIGVISVEHGVEPSEEVGYWVGPPFWNTGYGTEALRAVIQHRFEEGVPRLVGIVFQDNPQSAKVLTHCGFRYIGDEEGYSVARKSTVAQWRYELTEAQWTALAAS
ncbi:MAG: GNAT family N-acetyltransferase [Pseudomonadota bacterium]